MFCQINIRTCHENNDYDKYISQDDFPLPNTRYIIRYDFTLSSGVTIPENSVLVFEGGTLNGSTTLTLNGTGIEPNGCVLGNHIVSSITIAGTYKTGQCLFDIDATPMRPKWWNGAAWVDATGTAV